MNKDKTVRNVLLVEDEMLLALMLEDLLLDAGYFVRRATCLADALEETERNRFDVAILDINLGGNDVFPLAARLRYLQIPFVFASASDAACIGAEFRQYPLLVKPYTIVQVQQMLDTLLAEPTVDDPVLVPDRSLQQPLASTHVS